MTPGALHPSVTLADICTGTTKTRRHVSPATRTRVLRDYDVSDTASVGMEMDHLIPLALGGANTAANLWPEPALDYEIKDRLESEMQRRVCRAYETLTPAEAEEVLHQEQRESPRTGSRRSGGTWAGSGGTGRPATAWSRIGNDHTRLRGGLNAPGSMVGPGVVE